MLGVEPVRDAYGRVSDLRLIPSEQLGRPRVDVIVQTSGQFRDLAASRLALISRAVEMAAAATTTGTATAWRKARWRPKLARRAGAYPPKRRA